MIHNKQKPVSKFFLITNDELIFSTKELVKEERELSLEIIRHLQEIQTRQLYLARGFSSLFEMCIKEFGYSTAAAQRRIETMRLAVDVPEIQNKIAEGTLSLSNAANLQSFFKAETKNDRAYSPQEKLELIEICEGKSTRDVEKELVKRNPGITKKESIGTISEERRILTVSISVDLEKKLERLKGLLSHQLSAMKFEDLLEKMAEISLAKVDPLLKKDGRKVKRNVRTRKENESKEIKEVIKEVKIGDIQNVFPAPETGSRYISSNIKQKVWQENNGEGCLFTDLQTGRICGSQHFLQIDHIKPLSFGGKNSIDNLRILCAKHNRWEFKDLMRV